MAELRLATRRGPFEEILFGPDTVDRTDPQPTDSGPLTRQPVSDDRQLAPSASLEDLQNKVAKGTVDSGALAALLSGKTTTRVGLPELEGDSQNLAPGSFVFRDPREGDRRIRAGLHGPTAQLGADPNAVLSPDNILGSVQMFGPPTADTLDAWWNVHGPALSAQGYGYIPHPTDPALVLPGGQHVDLILGGGGPNPQWQWLLKNEFGGGFGGGGFGGGGFGGFDFGGGFGGSGGGTFDDPATALLEDFLQFRMNELLNPVVDPSRQALEADLQTRIGQLREPPFTTADESALRTGSIDEIERLRQAAQRNALERVSARGFLPTSGLAEQSALDIDQQFDALRAAESGQFSQLAVQEQQRRLDQALELANAVSLIEQQRQSEEDQRRNEILALASLGAELPERRLQLALATLGGTPPPGSLFNSVAALTGLQQQQNELALRSQAIQNQNQQLFGGGFGNLSALLSLVNHGGGGQEPRGGGQEPRGGGQEPLQSNPFASFLLAPPSLSSVGI